MNLRGARNNAAMTGRIPYNNFIFVRYSLDVTVGVNSGYDVHTSKVSFQNLIDLTLHDLSLKERLLSVFAPHHSINC